MDGQTIVNAAGAPIPIGVPVACKNATITALPSNTGNVAVGRAPAEYELVGSNGRYRSEGPNATTATAAGIILGAGESIMLEAKILTDLWVDVAVAGEGVAWSVEPACCTSCSGGPTAQVVTDRGVAAVEQRGGGCCGG